MQGSVKSRSTTRQSFNDKFARMKIFKRKKFRIIKSIFVFFLVLSWLLTGWPGIWFNPRFPKEIKEAKAVVPAGIIVGWPGTEGTIPSGWQRVGSSLDTYFLKGTTSDPSAVAGGASTHTHTSPTHTHTMGHTHTGTTGAASGTVTAQSSGQATADGHTHAITTAANSGSNNTQSASLGTASNNPSYTEVIWIQSLGTAEIPDTAVAFFNSDSSSFPSSWSRVYGGTYLKGAAGGSGGGGTGGLNSHNHTDSGHTHTEAAHTHTGTTDATTSYAGRTATGTTQATQTHTHTISGGSTTATEASDASGTVGSTTSEPPYYTLNIIQNGTGGGSTPTEIIAAWTGLIADIPSGWVLCDSTSGCPNLNNYFIKGATGDGQLGTTGGGTTHSHSTGNTHTHAIQSHTHGFTVNSTGTTTGVRNSGTSSSAGHTHTLSITQTGGNTGTATITADISATETQPPYKQAVFIQYKPVTFTQNDFRFYEDEATVSLTNLWGSFITGDNEDITVVPAANNPPAPGEQIRLQINLTVGLNNLSATSQAFKLQYKAGTDQDCSTGSWTDIGAKGGTGAAWRLFDNTSLGDTATEVNQISTSDVAGGYSELVTSGTNPNAVNIGQDVEWDWSIESYLGQVADATTYSFRMVKSDGSVITYSPAGDCPTIETEPGTANLMRHGDVFIDGSKKGYFWAE